MRSVRVFLAGLIVLGVAGCGTDDPALFSASPVPGADGGTEADGATDGPALDATTSEGGVDAAGDAPADGGGASAIAVFGEPCSMPGALACAGHAQKLTLICNGTTWASNGVCPGVQICDTRPGLTAGSCQDPVPACVNAKPGDIVCDGADRHVCGPDLLTSTVEPCTSEEHCELGTGPGCAPCLEGERRCNGSDLEVCALDLSGFSLSEACASAALCDSVGAKCDPAQCAAGQHRCSADLLERCTDDLTGFEQVQQCQAGLCDAAGKQCDVCVAGSSSCFSATVVLRCSSDGQSLASEPCPGNAPNCDQGQCVACLPTRSPAVWAPVDLYAMADRSGSMQGNLWTQQSAGLNAFFSDPASAGTGVALRFFPLNDSCTPTSPSCNGDTYVTPLVPWGQLPSNQGALSGAVSSTAPNGCFTPTQEALNGGLRGAVARKQANPGHTVALVLLSDGAPCCSDCPAETAVALGQIAATYFTGTPSIRSFTISLASSATATMTAIAQQGGGTVYNTATSAGIASAFATVRDTVGCALAVPDLAAPPELFSVEYQASAGLPFAVLPKVNDAGACQGAGWYFDDNLDPLTINLCPTSCAEARGGGTTEVVIDSCP